MSKNRHQRCDPHERAETTAASVSRRGNLPIFTAFLPRLLPAAAAVVLSWTAMIYFSPLSSGQDAEPQPAAGELEKSEQAATLLVESMLDYLAYGPALEAKLRVRAWGAETEVVEVGRYLQSGQGKGWMRMELEVPIADGKGRWQQTCDGRLVWTREELAGDIRVRRVDVGRLRELLDANGASRSGGASRVPPWFRVGGLAEILDRIRAEFRLTLGKGRIEQQPMLVIKGTVREDVASELAETHGGQFPAVLPRHIVIAVPVSSVEAPLPARIEYWTHAGGRLISLLEVYDSTLIESPPLDHFRFETGGGDFTNETDAYLARFGFVLAAKPGEG